MTLTDGTELTPALGIGAFADKTLVARGPVHEGRPAADPAVAGLLGCGVMAGLGAALNTGASPRRHRRRVRLWRCGRRGDRRRGAGRRQTIIAVDTDDRKLNWASEFGATHTINAKELDPSSPSRT